MPDSENQFSSNPSSSNVIDSNQGKKLPPLPPAVEKVRLDKWLWAARIFKTRSEAAEACKAGLVKLDTKRVKPSHWVQIGEILHVRKNELARIFEVVALLDRRVSAKIVDHFVRDLTPESEFEKLKNRKTAPVLYREKGQGRPTKRDRRAIEKFQDPGQ